MKKFQHGVVAVMLAVMSAFVLAACWGEDVGKKLTAENFNAIVITSTEPAREGDTFEKVKERLGKPTGEEKELTDGAGVIEWATKDGDKKITVTFTSGKASAKSQVGVLEEAGE